MAYHLKKVFLTEEEILAKKIGDEMLQAIEKQKPFRSVGKDAVSRWREEYSAITFGLFHGLDPGVWDMLSVAQQAKKNEEVILAIHMYKGILDLLPDIQDSEVIKMRRFCESQVAFLERLVGRTDVEDEVLENIRRISLWLESSTEAAPAKILRLIREIEAIPNEPNEMKRQVIEGLEDFIEINKYIPFMYKLEVPSVLKTVLVDILADLNQHNVREKAQLLQLRLASESISIQNEVRAELESLDCKVVSACLELIRAAEKRITERNFLRESQKKEETSAMQAITAYNRTNGNYRLRVVKVSDSSIIVVRETKDAQHFISGSSDGRLALWDKAISQCIWSVKAHEGGISSICETRNGQHIISGSCKSKIVKLWDRKIGRCVQEFDGALFNKKLGNVTSVEECQDSKILSLYSNGRVLLWDKLSGKCVKQHKEVEAGAWITFLGEVQDGDGYWCGLNTGLVKRLDKSFANQVMFSGHNGYISVIHESRNRAFFFSGSADGRVMLWSTESGNCIQVFSGAVGKCISSIQETPCQTQVLIGQKPGAITVWDRNTGTRIRAFEKVKGESCAVIQTQDGRRLISGVSDGTIRIYDFFHIEEEKGLPGDTLYQNNQKIKTVKGWIKIDSWGANNKKIKKAAEEICEAIQADPQNRKAFWTPEGIATMIELGQQATTEIAMAAVAKAILLITLTLDDCDGKKVYSTDPIKEMLIRFRRTAMSDSTKEWIQKAFDNLFGMESDDVHGSAIDAEQETISQNQREGNYRLRVLKGHQGEVTCVHETGDKQYLISGSRDGCLKLWDKATGQCSWSVRAHNLGVSCICEIGGQYIISGGNVSASIKVWDKNTGTCEKTLVGHRFGVRHLSVCQDNRRLISVSYDKTVKIWDLSTEMCIQQYKEEGLVSYITFFSETQDASGYWCGTSSGMITRLDKNFECIARYRGHTANISTIQESQEENRFFSGSADGSVILWSLETGARVRVFKQGREMGGLHGVTSIQETQYGNHICVNRGIIGMQLWDKDTGDFIRVFEKSNVVGYDMMQTKDGTNFVLGTTDGAIRIYDFCHIDETDCLPGDVLYQAGRKHVQLTEPEIIEVAHLICEAVQQKNHRRLNQVLTSQGVTEFVQIGQRITDESVIELVIKAILQLLRFSPEKKGLFIDPEVCNMLVEIGRRTTGDYMRSLILDIISEIASYNRGAQHLFFEDFRIYDMMLRFGNEARSEVLKRSVLMAIIAIVEDNANGKMKFGTKELMDMLIKFGYEAGSYHGFEEVLIRAIASVSVGDAINLQELISPKVAHLFKSMVERTDSWSTAEQIVDVVNQMIYERSDAKFLFEDVLAQVSRRNVDKTRWDRVKSKLKSCWCWKM